MINKIRNLLSNHRYLLSVICALFVFCLFFALNAFRFVNGSYEEYAFSLLLSRGDDVILFMGVFLSKLLAALQRAVSFVNVFSLFLILSGFLSFTVFNYILLGKYSLRLGVLLSLALDCLFMNVVVISIQWTHTATVVCLASMTLVFYSVMSEKRKKIKIMQLLFGALGIFLSAQLRFDAVKVCMTFGALFALCVFLRSVSENDKAPFLRKLVSGLGKSGPVILAAVLMLACSFACSLVSDAVKRSDGAYAGYEEYNAIRSQTEDYPIAEYEPNKAFYKSIEIYSKGDFDLLTCFKLDKDFFTEDRLETISAYAQEHDSGIQNIYMAYFRSLQKKVEGIAGNGFLVYPLLGAAALLALALMLLLYKIRNRIKLLFLVIYGCVWGVFVLLLGTGLLTGDMLTLTLFVLSTVIVLIGNRFQYLYAMLFDTSVLLLYNYMAHMRISFRVAITFLLPGIFLLLMLFDTKDIRKGLRTRCRQLPSWTGTVLTGLLAVALVVFVQSRIGIFAFDRAASKYDPELVGYISSHMDSVFFFDWYGCELVDHAKYDPLVVPDCPDNSVHYGSWPIASHLFENQLGELGIGHLHRDLINSERFKLVIAKEDAVYIKQLEDFYNTHYRNDADIVLQEVGSTARAWVYRVTEKK